MVRSGFFQPRTLNPNTPKAIFAVVRALQSFPKIGLHADWANGRNLAQIHSIRLQPTWGLHGATSDEPFALTWHPLASGGFSLQRVRDFHFSSSPIPRLKNRINDDQLWSFLGPYPGLRVATERDAGRFFLETTVAALDGSSLLSSGYGEDGLEKLNPDLESGQVASFGVDFESDIYVTLVGAVDFA
jgi:hypothetical protein